jgi:phosphate transport system substrate-binding protein
MLILNQRWAEAFSKTNPSISVDVTGGGSSIGIRSFINRVCDVCASSRKMKASEVQSARSNRAVSNEIAVALDGLAIAVNQSNPIKSISMDQLRKVYIGQIKNWSQLGGENAPIITFSRDSNSGTYGFFQEKVLRNQNWGGQVRFMPSTSEESREIARTENGIAYGGVAYFKGKKGVKIVPVSIKDGGEALAPNEANVRSKTYPIWRYLYYYTNGKPTGATKTFIDYVLSPAGQKVVEQVGYYSLN